MIQALQQYTSLGWDFDDTLIDHPLSQLFWDFIIDNPYQQEHHIVTFRSGGLEARIFHDLNMRASFLNRDHFTGVHNIDHALWADHHIGDGKAPPPLILSLDQLSDDPYMLWKGEKCAELGIEVLIDDMTKNVIHGCRKHGVTHFHPDDLA